MAVIASGQSVVLRDRDGSDVDRFIYWQTHGEWRLFDAPWEGMLTSLTSDQESRLRGEFLESCGLEQPTPPRVAIIADNDDRPLGTVNRYGEDHSAGTWMVGIDICEDEALAKGLGTDALRLWVDHLFANSNAHRLGLDTWSLNPRMSRVAEKVGFAREGVEREKRQWEGQRLDLLHFGLQRAQWQKGRKTGTTGPGRGAFQQSQAERI
jgi:RimJ/RimL family protein N-acetyltransferase